MNRTWDRTWMDIADVMARRSRCDRAQIGCVIVSDQQRVVSTGYNGPPARLPTDGTCRGWCERARRGVAAQSYDNCPSVHAELNAIAYANRAQMEDGCLYVSSAMCYNCAKVVANSGIKRVVLRRDAPERDQDVVIAFLRVCALEVVVWAS